MENQMKTPIVNTPIPSDIDGFLKENNFELANEVGVTGRYLYDLYFSNEHQMIVVPNKEYGDGLRYEVYTFNEYYSDSYDFDTIMWKPSEEYPTFLPYLKLRMKNNNQ